MNGVAIDVVKGNLLEFKANAIAISVGAKFELKGMEKNINHVLYVNKL